MAKIQSYLDDQTFALLEAYAQERGCSRSQAMSILLSDALQNQKQTSKPVSLADGQYWTIINLLYQLFFCVYDGKKPAIETFSGSDEAKLYLKSLMATVMNPAQKEYD